LQVIEVTQDAAPISPLAALGLVLGVHPVEHGPCSCGCLCGMCHDTSRDLRNEHDEDGDAADGNCQCGTAPRLVSYGHVTSLLRGKTRLEARRDREQITFNAETAEAAENKCPRISQRALRALRSNVAFVTSSRRPSFWEGRE